MSNIADLISKEFYIMQRYGDGIGCVRRKGYIFKERVSGVVTFELTAYWEDGFVHISDYSTGVCIKSFNFKDKVVDEVDAIKESVARFVTDSELVGSYLGFVDSKRYRVYREAFSLVCRARENLGISTKEDWVHRQG